MQEAAMLLSEAGELSPDHFGHRVLGKQTKKGSDALDSWKIG